MIKTIKMGIIVDVEIPDFVNLKEVEECEVEIPEIQISKIENVDVIIPDVELAKLEIIKIKNPKVDKAKIYHEVEIEADNSLLEEEIQISYHDDFDKPTKPKRKMNRK